MKMDKGTVIRTFILFVAWVNTFLTMAGKSPLPFSDEQVEMFVSGAITFIVSLVAWYKNNYVTKKGLQQKETLKKHGLTK